LVAEKWLNYDTLTVGEIIFDTVAFDTRTLAGNYTIWMEVNPEDSLWHKEQFHFNNTAFKTFSVSTDNQNPLLDVTFDGIHILNGDIVSPSPSIVMQLKDENKLLLLNDTSSFEVFLMSENTQQKRIPFIKNGVENMVFEPAVNTQNKARLTWNPEALADGKYTLSVIAKDASGNLSGNTSYRIEFDVINKSTVSSVMNYPNPFTTATRFVFTLTGSQIPDVFTIQIMSVTGKVLREITKAELGNITIGRNITEYAWDGTDEFGDRLANGVYLYRVIMKIAGETIEHRASGADDYFIKDFGKMYLFR
jgi:flagellar hook assembly protein FlgD